MTSVGFTTFAKPLKKPAAMAEKSQIKLKLADEVILRHTNCHHWIYSMPG
jgi:hypothetical protein